MAYGKQSVCSTISTTCHQKLKLAHYRAFQIIALINTAPVKKCPSKRLDDLIAAKERAELASGVDPHPALGAFMKYQNIDKLTRDILVKLADHIKVYENGNISVRFKFADELRKIIEYIELNTEATAALAV